MLAPSPRALQLQLSSPWGFTVYAYPDWSHLVASRPEDHTSFSVTGAPGPAPRWVGNAVDIMPRNDSRTADEELEALAVRIIADRQAGVPGTEWIKYINWTESSGECWHTSWESGRKVTTSSTDKGHIHISGLSTWATRAAIPYDPMVRLYGAVEEDDPVANTWTQGLTQGTAGYAGQQRDTALAFAWQSAAEAAQNSAATLELVKVIAGKVDIDPTELAAITAAAKAGAAAAIAEQADGQARAIVAQLATMGIGSVANHNEMVSAVRQVLLDGVAPKAGA